MALRLIATDLDGTVLRSDGTVAPRTATALRTAEERGVMVVVATGRPPRWMRPAAEALGHTGLAICANGAIIYNLQTDRVVEHTPITRAVVLEVTAAVRAAVPGVTFAVETHDRGFAGEPDYPQGMDAAGVVIGVLDEIVGDDVVKLLVRHRDLDPDGLLEAAREVAGGIAEFTHSSRSGLLEISASGVTKAATLARMAARHGIGPDQAVAFGDMPNDLPMLAWAGTGYAMANAHRDVLAVTDHIAPSNDEDGVAQVIETLLA